jgi:DNA polymerase III alpha subunit
MAEARTLGISIRPPHINHSGRRFTLVYETQGDEQRPVFWMGLDQVRDLSRSSIKEIVRERRERPFEGLGDLLRRVSLQVKEADHLIRCGGLDGLAENRAELLAEAQQVARAGNALQLALPFDRPPAAPETPADRFSWERELLGIPVSVHPLELIEAEAGKWRPLRTLPESAGAPVTVAGARLPGWTGGEGFFFSDDDTFLIVRLPRGQQAPHPWEPLVVTGRYVTDAWGSRWLQASSVESL